MNNSIIKSKEELIAQSLALLTECPSVYHQMLLLCHMNARTFVDCTRWGYSAEDAVEIAMEASRDLIDKLAEGMIAGRMAGPSD